MDIKKIYNELKEFENEIILKKYGIEMSVNEFYAWIMENELEYFLES